MEYRKATPDDVEILIELRKQMLIEGGLPESENIDEQLRTYFRSAIENGMFISWLALENDTVVAASGLFFYQMPPSFPNPSGMAATVTNVYTAKEYRRKGISSILLEKILNEARALNHTMVRLHASPVGRKMYEKFGFTDSHGYMSLKL